MTPCQYADGSISDEAFVITPVASPVANEPKELLFCRISAEPFSHTMR